MPAIQANKSADPPAARYVASRGLAMALGVTDPLVLDEIAALLTPKWAKGGEIIIRQGEPSEELFFLSSGRLQVIADAGTANSHIICDVVRGETVGEMGVIAALPRSATVQALRDCELLALSRTHLELILRKHAEISLALARQVVLRLARKDQHATRFKRAAFVAISSNEAGLADCSQFATDLARSATRFGAVKVVSWAEARRTVGQDFLSKPDEFLSDKFIDAEAGRIVSSWLNDFEVDHELILLIISDPKSWWGRHCIRHCDEVLVIRSSRGDATSKEHDLGNLAAGVPCRLVLVHPDNEPFPLHTARWLSDRTTEVVHLRQRQADFDRLARSIAGQSVGIAFSGGGARAFAHLGVYKALFDAGVPLDVIAGTSMGAAVGSFVALGCTPDEAIAMVREVFRARPTSDFNWLPLISLISGRRLKNALEKAYVGQGGTPLNIEDCWKPFYCIVSDFSNARMNSCRRGPLSALIRASTAVPGLMPPVFHEGSALIDGGVFNNLPTDVLRTAGLQHVIGVDLRLAPFGPSPDVGIPPAFATLKHWGSRAAPLTPRIPSMRELLLRLPTLNSSRHQQYSASLASILLRPDVADLGIIDWRSIDVAITRGYRHTADQIEGGGLDALIALAR